MFANACASQCECGTVNVRYALKATEVLHCREWSLWANNGLMHCNMIGATQKRKTAVLPLLAPAKQTHRAEAGGEEW
jgi:hypothetical protein